MVVKAALDLLIIFVNYSDSGQVTPSSGGAGSPSGSSSPDGLPSNALLFKDAVEISSEDHSRLPWSYLLAIIGETSTADPDVQAKAMSLINKVRREGGEREGGREGGKEGGKRERETVVSQEER